MKKEWMLGADKKCFFSVYGFGPKRLLILHRKLGESGASVEPDKRGKHESHPAVEEEVKDLVKEHIHSFPTRHSHYSRKDNAGRVIYLQNFLYLASTVIS